MKKHQFEDCGEVKALFGRTLTKYKCSYCGKTFNLDNNLIESLPANMAKCKESKVKSKLMESVIGAYDCLKK